MSRALASDKSSLKGGDTDRLVNGLAPALAKVLLQREYEEGTSCLQDLIGEPPSQEDFLHAWGCEGPQDVVLRGLLWLLCAAHAGLVITGDVHSLWVQVGLEKTLDEVHKAVEFIFIGIGSADEVVEMKKALYHLVR